MCTGVCHFVPAPGQPLNVTVTQVAGKAGRVRINALCPSEVDRHTLITGFRYTSRYQRSNRDEVGGLCSDSLCCWCMLDVCLVDLTYQPDRHFIFAVNVDSFWVIAINIGCAGISVTKNVIASKWKWCNLGVLSYTLMERLNISVPHNILHIRHDKICDKYVIYSFNINDANPACIQK